MDDRRPGPGIQGELWDGLLHLSTVRPGVHVRARPATIDRSTNHLQKEGVRPGRPQALDLDQDLSGELARKLGDDD